MSLHDFKINKKINVVDEWDKIKYLGLKMNSASSEVWLTVLFRGYGDGL